MLLAPFMKGCKVDYTRFTMEKLLPDISVLTEFWQHISGRTFSPTNLLCTFNYFQVGKRCEPDTYLILTKVLFLWRGNEGNRTTTKQHAFSNVSSSPFSLQKLGEYLPLQKYRISGNLSDNQNQSHSSASPKRSVSGFWNRPSAESWPHSPRRHPEHCFSLGVFRFFYNARCRPLI